MRFYLSLFLLISATLYLSLFRLPRRSHTHVVARSPPRPAVIALAAGYGPRAFRNFVGSLRSSGYNGLLILGVNAVQENLGDNVRQQVISSQSNAELFRYQWYSEMLSNVTHALLTDFRDVYFQDNPFRTLPHGLHLFGEHSSTNLGLDNHNTWWIEKCDTNICESQGNCPQRGSEDHCGF